MRFILFLLFAVVIVAPASAAPIPGTGCDSDFMGIMDRRAWMEGKHDMEAAQVLLTRPKSILDISCFEEHLVDLHRSADSMFSDNTGGVLFKNRNFPTNMALFEPQYQPIIIGAAHTYLSPMTGFYRSEGYFSLPPQLPISPVRLDNSLIRLVRNGLKNYFNATFYTTPPVPPVPRTVCNWMGIVWGEAKCENAGNTMWQFRGIAVIDPRLLPRPCNSQRQDWRQAIAIAFPPQPGRPGAVEPVQTFLENIDPTKCTTQSPIVTGIIARYSGQDPFPEKICLSPGCWYDRAADRCAP